MLRGRAKIIVVTSHRIASHQREHIFDDDDNYMRQAMKFSFNGIHGAGCHKWIGFVLLLRGSTAYY